LSIFPAALLGYRAVTWLGLPPWVLGLITYAAVLALVYSALATIWLGMDGIGRVFVRRNQQEGGNKTDEILITFIVRFAKIILVTVGLIVAGSSLGYDITAFMAGLGIGGVAIALAAKNTLENLLGTVTILTDRSFRIGDRIRINNVEGVVTKVGLRSTRILTATDSAVTLPNHQFVGSTIENFGPVPKRIWKTTLAIDPSNSPDKLGTFLEDLRILIKKQAGVAGDSVLVRASDFGPRSILVSIVARIRALDDSSEMSIREQLVLELNGLLALHEIKISPPGT
jgi:MscS family membrane protein